MTNVSNPLISECLARQKIGDHHVLRHSIQCDKNIHELVTKHIAMCYSCFTLFFLQIDQNRYMCNCCSLYPQFLWTTFFFFGARDLFHFMAPCTQNSNDSKQVTTQNLQYSPIVSLGAIFQQQQCSRIGICVSDPHDCFVMADNELDAREFSSS